MAESRVANRLVVVLGPKETMHMIRYWRLVMGEGCVP